MFEATLPRPWHHAIPGARFWIAWFSIQNRRFCATKFWHPLRGFPESGCFQHHTKTSKMGSHLKPVTRQPMKLFPILHMLWYPHLPHFPTSSFVKTLSHPCLSGVQWSKRLILGCPTLSGQDKNSENMQECASDFLHVPLQGHQEEPKEKQGQYAWIVRGAALCREPPGQCLLVLRPRHCSWTHPPCAIPVQP